jgi:prophage antirepressor-like protein
MHSHKRPAYVVISTPTVGFFFVAILIAMLMIKNEIQLFESPNFGQIRTSLSASNEPLFCLSDICKSLDLEQVSKVKQRLRKKGVTTIPVLTNGGIQQANFVDEANLYRCIFQSRKPEAEQFQDWVCSEILPAIRRTGGYMVSAPEETPEQTKFLQNRLQIRKTCVSLRSNNLLLTWLRVFFIPFWQVLNIFR